MKTLRFILCSLFCILITSVCYADEPIKKEATKKETITSDHEKTATQILEKMEKDISLTKDQKAQLKKVIVNYLILKSEAMDKIKTNTENLNITALVEIEDSYQASINEILTEKQREELKAKQKERYEQSLKK